MIKSVVNIIFVGFGLLWGYPYFYDSILTIKVNMYQNEVGGKSQEKLIISTALSAVNVADTYILFI